MTLGRFHDGEIAAQVLLNHRDRVAPLEASVFKDRPFTERRADLLRSLRTVVLATSGVDGLFLSVEPGPASVLNERTVSIELRDPSAVAQRLASNPKVATILIDHPTASRYRVNGLARVEAGRLVLTAQQAFSNCPVYINDVHTAFTPLGDLPRAVYHPAAPALTDDVAAAIAATDHLYIASRDADGDLDVQYKGGLPGWVRARDWQTIVYPEYPGNKWHVTIGNFLEDNAACLLFPNGYLVSGRAILSAEPSDLSDHPGAQAVVRVIIDRLVRVDNVGLGPQTLISAALPADILLARERRVRPTM